MQTLTYGFKKPETGDKGTVFFPALEDNVDRLDSHSHNGTNSPKLSSENVDAYAQTIGAGSWASIGTDSYRMLVTMPVTLEFDKCTMLFLINSGAASGQVFYPTVSRQSANTYYIYSCDGSIDVKVQYS